MPQPITETERAAAATDPRVARRLVAEGHQCDHCTAASFTFVIDGVTTRLLCRDGYLAHIAAARAARTATLT